MEGSLLIEKMTGSWPVYPGHPLVLATAIMKIFPTFTDANATTEHGWSAALSDQRIPGAGDHVGAAMRVLEIGAKGGAVDEMVQYATRYWTDGRAGGHERNVASGIEQAAAIEPHFRAAAASWFTAPALAETSAG
ncbi:hypothetical protein ABIC83_002470 [Roseateles asaccharophilus]|uniref:hypothetical protein n=1 Tax=Roseateles asaccharophilus TaxID=582607 RepID=UPI0038337A71